MNLLLILTVFINYLCIIIGSPVPDTSVYEVIKQSANDPKLNCTEVRSTLVEPQVTFLTKCLYKNAISVGADKTEDADLCLLYYSNVMNLCKISIDFSQLNLKTKLDEDAKISQRLPEVCGTIVNETKLFVYDDEVKESVVLTSKKLNFKYCASLCLMENLYIKPECILNAFMLKTVSSLKTKSFKPLHTVKDGPETHEPVIIEEPKIDETAAQSNNADGKPPVTNQPTSTLELKAEVPLLKIETKPEQIVKQPNVNPDETPSVVNPLDSGKSKLPEANAVNDNTVKVDLDKKTLQSNLQASVSKKPNSADDKNIPDQQQITTLDKQDKTNENTENKQDETQQNTEIKQDKTQQNTEIKQDKTKENTEIKQEKTKQNTENISAEKVALNAQDVSSGKTTIKLPEEKKPEGSNAVGESDFTLIEEGKQVTNNKNEVVNPIPEKNSFDNNLEKEETPDLGGDGDDLTAAINDAEDYPETPELALDNAGIAEVLSGNSAPVANEKPKSSEVKTKIPEKLNNKPQETNEDDDGLPANYQNQSIDDSDSYFFSYFMMVCIMFICGYVAYHNKQKILALVVEGRRGRRTSRSRRPNSANYRKLDSNLEEAVTSSCNKNTTQIIY